MIVLPKTEVLTECVRSALDKVAARHTEKAISNADWFPEIATEIANSAVNCANGQTIKCYARGKKRSEPADGCTGSEWLFDFVALLDDTDVPEQDRFMAQAALVGEVEWGRYGIDEDFEKLLIVDSIVCFMVFQEWSVEDANISLNRLQSAARRRQQYARQRGLVPPPTFVLSCYVIDDRFVHNIV